MTLVVRSRLWARPATWGAKPSSRVGGDVVLEREAALGSGDQRPVDRLGQALLGPPLGLGHCLEPLVSHSAPLSARVVVLFSQDSSRKLRVNDPAHVA